MPKVSLEQLSRLIDRIYVDAEEAHSWADCLLAICRDLDASATNLFTFTSEGVPSSVIHAGIDPAVISLYMSHFQALAPWRSRRPVPRVPVGQVEPGHAVVTHAEMKKTQFYADFGRAAGITRGLHAIVMQDVDGSRLGLSINRGDRHPEFAEEDIAYVQALLPHLARAQQIRTRLSASNRDGQAILEVLESLPLAVILVDAEARVRHANASALRLLQQRGGLAIDRDGRVRGSTPDVTRRLRTTCAEAVFNRPSPSHAGGALNLPQPAGGTPWHVLVLPIRARGPLASVHPAAAAVLYVTDPSDSVKPDQDVLRTTFGLTGAEARVASLLATGKELRVVASELGYTLETTRWYVKRVLGKTDSRSRAQLVARLASSVAALRRI